MRPYYAHSLPGEPQEKWEPLYTGDGTGHLEKVAALAAEFAAKFGAAEWGRVAGLWHDLGKYQLEFQDYLEGRHTGVEHAGAGAALAQSWKVRDAAALCFAIAGHHTGLANAQSNESAESLGPVSLPTPLLERLRNNQWVLERIRPVIPSELNGLRLPETPQFLCGRQEREFKRAFEFWTRMVFSALVDADRLAAAKFSAQYNPTLLHEDLQYHDLQTLADQLDSHIDKLAASADPTPVNELRAEILAACRAAVGLPVGRFSMTAPTGGGKTLSAMSFALRHAIRHGLHRVIVVIPYTSIIEQNAKIYRDILGTDNVLEHHSNLDEAKLEEIDTESEAKRRLAAENWDAPLVVTTSVQFFESLFSNHPSRCRKLHNIAKSVVVLDEVQTLPPQLLEPMLDVLGELTRCYCCSILLSTATPPALVKRQPEQSYGLSNVTEIMPNPSDLAKRARRVRVNWQIDDTVAYADLAKRMVRHEKVLAIVHQRRDARELAQLLQRLRPNEPVCHLSALMCPAHRLRILRQIRIALDRYPICRVVATQLVEAGVDIDFPVVYRALAGLDSIAQAAGRCDREGKLTDRNGGKPGGELVVFRAPTQPPPGVLRKAIESTRTLFRLRGAVDPFDPATCEAYFCELYGKHDLDDRAIQRDRHNLDFATVALKFRMIDSAMRPVVVPYEDAMGRVQEFQHSPSRKTQRALQPFIVQISPSHHAAMQALGALETIHDRVDMLTPLFWSRYDHTQFGLDPDFDAVMDAEITIC